MSLLFGKYFTFNLMIQRFDRQRKNFFTLRHAKSREHETICLGNIFRMRKDKCWNTDEFVETISLNSFLHEELGITSIDISEKSKSA